MIPGRPTRVGLLRRRSTSTTRRFSDMASALLPRRSSVTHDGCGPPMARPSSRGSGTARFVVDLAGRALLRFELHGRLWLIVGSSSLSVRVEGPRFSWLYLWLEPRTRAGSCDSTLESSGSRERYGEPPVASSPEHRCCGRGIRRPSANAIHSIAEGSLSIGWQRCGLDLYFWKS